MSERPQVTAPADRRCGTCRFYLSESDECGWLAQHDNLPYWMSSIHPALVFQSSGIACRTWDKKDA